MEINRYLELLDRERGRSCSLAFVGLGVSNLALLGQLSRGGRQITVRTEAEACTLPDAYRGMKVRTGAKCFEPPYEDLLILSPSVRRERAELIAAVGSGSVLTSDAELFFTDPPTTLGVTGSDGKSTTCRMAAEMIRYSGIDVEELGNSGTPFAEGGGCLTVAELSSFTLRYLKPHLAGAVITSLSPNHLNWHADKEEYYLAKAAIYENAERIILNADDPEAVKLTRARPYAVCSIEKSIEELTAFGAEVCYTLSDGCILRNRKPLMPVSELSRREYYNIKNAMLAAALTEGYTTEEGVRAALGKFKGLSHRAELFLSVNGIDFIDSSIDTTPDRCSATLRALARPVLLLLGGRGKRVSAEGVLGDIARYARAVALYGEFGEELDALLERDERTRDIPRKRYTDFNGAVGYLLSVASAGDTVLLSPAATAFDQFRDYRERGDRFKELVGDFYR